MPPPQAPGQPQVPGPRYTQDFTCGPAVNGTVVNGISPCARWNPAFGHLPVTAPPPKGQFYAFNLCTGLAAAPGMTSFDDLAAQGQVRACTPATANRIWIDGGNPESYVFNVRNCPPGPGVYQCTGGSVGFLPNGCHLDAMSGWFYGTNCPRNLADLPKNLNLCVTQLAGIVRDANDPTRIVMPEMASQYSCRRPLQQQGVGQDQNQARKRSGGGPPVGLLIVAAGAAGGGLIAAEVAKSTLNNCSLAGTYTGTITGTFTSGPLAGHADNGTLQFLVSGSSVTLVLPTSGTGTVTSCSEVTFGFSDPSTGGSATFSGTIFSGGASGTWSNVQSNPAGSASGTWTATGQ